MARCVNYRVHYRARLFWFFVNYRKWCVHYLLGRNGRLRSGNLGQPPL